MKSENFSYDYIIYLLNMKSKTISNGLSFEFMALTLIRREDQCGRK